MNFQGLDLNLLVVLDTLLETRSVTLTAERLHVSQSAASASLSRLREYFNDPILVQMGSSEGGKRMVPTTFGERLIEPISDILIRVRSTIKLDPQFDIKKSTQHIRIITSEYVETVLLSMALSIAEQQAPNITFEILTSTASLSNHNAIARAEVDFVIDPFDQLSEQHPTSILFEDTGSCIGWSGNTHNGNFMTVEECINYGHVRVRFKGTRVMSDFNPELISLINSIRTEIVTTSFTSIPQYIIGTQRLSIIPKLMATYISEHWKIKEYELPLDLSNLIIALQWNSLFENDPVNIWFRDLLERVAKNLPRS